MEQEKRTVKERIYALLMDRGESTVQQIMAVGDFGGRTYVSRILAALRNEGRVAMRRAGRHVWYRVVDVLVAYEDTLALRGLAEDEIWRQVAGKADFVAKMSEQAKDIMQFSFTEMLNNAVDHSRSGMAYVKVWYEAGEVKFVIRDHGVGVFRNVMTDRELPDELTAIQELVKGKVTTAPEAHSGEGIFWTSKIADKFELESYGWRLLVDNGVGDYAVEKKEGVLVGTEVRFELAARTEKSMNEMFQTYALNNSYSFDTTMIPVKLYEAGEVWISRSQAKRVLRGLEKYKKVIFDFKGIDLVGQGFADEIFRVFRRNHPEIELEPVNMKESVRLLVERAMGDELWRG